MEWEAALRHGALMLSFWPANHGLTRTKLAAAEFNKRGRQNTRARAANTFEILAKLW